MSNLVKNSVIYALGDILPKLFSFITFPVLTHYLTPAEYGIINYVNTLNVFLIIFSVLCLNTYYLVFYFRQDSEEARQRLLGNLSVFIIGLNIIVSLLVLLLGYYFSDSVQNEIPFYPYIALGVGINFFNVFSVLPMATYRVEENPIPVTFINVIKGGLVMVLTLLLVVKYDYKATGVLFASFLIHVSFSIYFIRVTLKKCILCFRWNQIKQALLFSLPLVPGSISYYLVSVSDRFLIEKFVGLTNLGIYSTASTLALLLNIISQGAYKSFEPYFFKIYGSNMFIARFRKIHNAFFSILALGVSGLSLFSKEFLMIFSSEAFHMAYLYVPILLIGVSSSGMSILYGTILTAQGKTKVNSLISMIGGGSSVGINLLLLPYFGIWGACFTSAFCLTGMLLASVFYSKISVQFRPILLSVLLISILLYFSVYVLDIESMVWSIIIKIFVLAMICGVLICQFRYKINRMYESIFS